MKTNRRSSAVEQMLVTEQNVSAYVDDIVRMHNEIESKYKEVKRKMNKIDWKSKLGSRKFWALLASLIIALLAMFALPENVITQVGGIVTALGGIAVYILGESKVDAAREVPRAMNIENYFNKLDATENTDCSE